MKITAFAKTDKGDTRKHNEDAYGLFLEEHFYVLADGVGGHLGGEFAAKEVVDQLYFNLQRFFLKLEDCSESEIQNFLKMAISEVNQIIINKGLERDELKGMASTFCFLLINQNKAFFSHYGDSRICLFRNQNLELLTKDHTLAQELKDANERIISEREKNTLTKAMGLKEIEKAQVSIKSVLKNDLFLIASDGLFEKMSLENINFIFNKYSSPKQILEKIILAARKQGARDNITAIIVQTT